MIYNLKLNPTILKSKNNANSNNNYKLLLENESNSVFDQLNIQ